MKAVIIGLGLMGGSLGLSLKRTGIFTKILGHDHNFSHCEDALSLGLVDAICDEEEVLTCDAIFLAIPVNGIIKSLQHLKDVKQNALIVDLGSTKADIVNACPKSIRKNLVAAHPMTGTEKSGPDAAFEGLYTDKVVVLCDIKSSGETQQALAIKIFEALQMNIVHMDDAKDHDRHASFISHMPHALSYALANSVMKQEDPKSILALAAGGFRDMSRLAKSSPLMWGDIFTQNQTNLLDAITIFQEELAYAKTLIEENNQEKLKQWMEEASTLHKIL